MSELTGGQKVKVLLSTNTYLVNQMFYFLDEPTNGLDIQSINWLEEFLIEL
jgi:ATPase subunit of ABC transporter with duplicated ATPase domains